VTREQEREAADLMRQAQHGDQAAYASLLVLLTGVCRRFASARLGGAPSLEDVVQETLITIHTARHTYDTARPFAPWFYAIATNRLIDVVRRERRVHRRESAVDSLPDVASPESSREGLDVEAIHAALAALPERQRRVIEGLKFQDRSVKEMAGVMNMSESAVKVTAHRGYRALKRLLGGGREN
jgi:RNA polymerase sigma-70 factor (ECF subfamily)